MDEKKQIEEMMSVLYEGMKPLKETYGIYEISHILYSAGYRKQSGWISVDERLPEENARVLVYLTHQAYGHTHMDTDRIYGGTWVRWSGSITHWMPLPEPPKGEDDDATK